jgi:hypothetical protein
LRKRICVGYTRLIEVGRGYDMESNAEKNKAMRISREPTPL